ncbi:thioredoxin domain-containing protein [Candidatus Woesearchaeota archaeon]|jgi:hypothetical protein|nr:thioredoxin domain-containing protein [Candidatus Woesearchaeota archaeon]
MSDKKGDAKKKDRPCVKVYKQVRKNPWIISTIILAIIGIILLIVQATSGVSANTAAQNLVDYAAAQGAQLEVVDVKEVSGMYEVTVTIEGQEGLFYVTKDGKSYSSMLLPMETSETPSQPTQPAPTEVPKSDKPEVELYVMTHCPYGTQAEKGFLPAIAELGDSIDAKIKFTHFFLHEPEYTETPNQICLREEQNDKFVPYLTCFLEDGDADRCLSEVKADMTKLNDCKENSYDAYYAADSALSEGYSVRGSPTLIINGAQVSTGRSPAAILATICAAFNDEPSACSASLDSANPAPGFGWDAASASSASAAQCG